MAVDVRVLVVASAGESVVVGDAEQDYWIVQF